MALEESRQMSPPRAGRVLDAEAGRDVFSHGRVAVDGSAQEVASHLWWVRWRRDRRQPWTQRLLTDPVVHVTVEQTGPRSTRTGRTPTLHGLGMPAVLVHGPVTRLWTVELPLQGRTSGIAFHPGGFAALLDLDVSTLRSRVVPAEHLLPGAAELRNDVLAQAEEAGRRVVLQSWLQERHELAATRLAADTAYRTVRRAVDVMEAREHVRIDTVAEAVSASPRSLQRWFTGYVGVSPLRVLRRHRLQDAVAALERGEPDLAGLAAELGWSDHAHFGREFRAVVGVPPEEYRRRSAASGAAGHDQVTIGRDGQPAEGPGTSRR